MSAQERAQATLSQLDKEVRTAPELWCSRPDGLLCRRSIDV
jgi:hypothetical protein